ncbi:site-specific integrase [Streptomyces avermitilis]|uniref:site-specific integrase n=1 Tax=Streptomyces avermitilis TaxID=33903 RepID=UPI0033CD9021
MWDRWSVEFYDFLKPPPSLGEGMLGGFGDLHDRAARNGAQHGTPVLVTVSGFADPGVNLFFRVSPMKGRGARTWKRYAYTLVVWLNFLQVFGKGWREATARDVEAFKDWRLTDVRNDDRIKAVSFDTDRAALNTFYTWAWRKYGVQNPVSGVALASSSGGRSGQGVGPGGERRDGFRPAGSRGRQVKWMLRAPFEQWRDIGLRGYGFDGLRRAGWSGPNEDRDTVFVDGLYGTGLRLQEWGSVLDVEMPRSAGGRLLRAWLAAACVKGAKEGRWYRIPRAVLREIEGYTDPLEGSRTQAIRRAQRRGTYEKIPYKRVVRGYNARSRLLHLESGGSLSVDVLGPDERRLLFRRTTTGLEPLALWLSPNGMPKKFEGWEDTFNAANKRIQRVWARCGRGGARAVVVSPAHVPTFLRSQVVFAALYGVAAPAGWVHRAGTPGHPGDVRRRVVRAVPHVGARGSVHNAGDVSEPSGIASDGREAAGREVRAGPSEDSVLLQLGGLSWEFGDQIPSDAGFAL